MNNLFFWDNDSLDGEPYPKHNCIIIDLPKKVLEKLSKEEVEKKVKKYLAKGVMPIIFYN